MDRDGAGVGAGGSSTQGAVDVCLIGD
jgi:hypothetical protein